MSDLRQKTIRAGSAKVSAQAAGLLLRVGSLMVLARLLDPKDFGLIGMVTALTGVLDVLRDFGLSAASVQRPVVSKEQVSTLFWVNLAVGGMLTMCTLAIAPIVGSFYNEPQLTWITSVVAIGFLLNGAGVQHSAMLQRQMRFTAMALIDITALTLSVCIGIGMAAIGCGYWALVAMTVALPLTTTLGLWATTGWVPGRPCGSVGILDMLRFGGTMTLNSVILYLAFNIDKVLLGRFWGAEAIGIYGRAFQLIRIPTDNLNSAVGGVAFAALSRMQHDPERLRRYFLRGYSLVVALTLPITMACALFADDLVLVLLGPRWQDAAVLFRILTPTILALAIANPLGWLLNALGLVKRSLMIALVFAPVLIVAYIIALPYGAKGIALAYSAVMTLGLVPISLWAVRGTIISVRDIFEALKRPLASSIAAAAVALVAQVYFGPLLSALPRLLLDVVIFNLAYVGVLLFVAGQKREYLDLLRSLKQPAS